MSKRLGKGLDALIPSLSVSDDDKIIEVSLKELRPNPYQPRKHFDHESIQELAESISQHGVIQPIIVRKVLKGYEIIAGERRYRASEVAGKKSIPTVIRSFTDQQVMEIALIENVQRENLNALEVATAYQALMEEFKMTQEELATKVGKSRSHIANFLRLLSLPDAVKEHVSRGTLSMGHARSLVSVKKEELIIALANKAIEQAWNVRQLEEAVQNLDKKKEDSTKSKIKKTDPYLVDVEETLRDRFQTTVKIKHSNKDKGKIELNYYSKQDLERLLEMLNQM